MGVTLNNTGAGGTVNISLNFITSYGLTGKVQYFKRKVPGKTTPKTDTTTMAVSPSMYDIQAFINSSERTTLETLKGQPQYTIVYSDNELSNKNCRYEDIEFNANPGVEDGAPDGIPRLPWVVRIRLTGIDH